MNCTGCWDGLDVERRAIITLSGTDLIQSTDNKPPMIRYTAQIARPSQLGGGESAVKSGDRKNFYVVEGTGPNLSSAIETMQRKIPRRIFLAHRRIIIIGESLAQKSIRSVIDEVVRNPESRLRTYILITKGIDASQIVRMPYPLSRLPADALWEMERTGDAAKVDVAEFAAMMLDSGRDPYAMGVQEATDDKKNPTFQLKDIALFQRDKLVGWLSGENAEGLMWIVGHVHSSSMSMTMPNHQGIISSRLGQIHSRIYAIQRNKKIHIFIDIHAKDDIYENGTDLNLSDPKILEKFQEQLKQALQAEIHQTLLVLRQFRVDPVGFGRLIRQSYPNEWDHLQSNWQTEMLSIPITVHVDIKVLRPGKIESALFQHKESV